MTGKTYKLTTLKDVFDNVPADRIETCLAEIARSMVFGKKLGVELQWVDPCEWTDDGLRQQTISFHDEANREAFTFRYEDDAP